MDTPVLVIIDEILKQNIIAMAQLSARAGVSLRPHIKSHKLPQIARKQIVNGAIGITAAKLGEAEIMADHGINDIFIANQIISEEKINRFIKLRRKIRLSLGVDSFEGVHILAESARRNLQQNVEVLIEIDTGLHRCGVLPDVALALAHEIVSIDVLKLKSIFTHAGNSYGAKNPKELQSIAINEGELMVSCAEEIRNSGIPVEVVSVGSTPTVGISAFVPGVTEIRPGNYVFYDAMQMSLGVIPGIEHCALRIYSTVISHPASGRWVIDAGSKTLALDQGAHGHTGVKGFGILVGHPNLAITRLSEEHGIIEGIDNQLKVGDIVEIIPNHACTVLNLFDNVKVCAPNFEETWPIAARGKNQ